MQLCVCEASDLLERATEISYFCYIISFMIRNVRLCPEVVVAAFRAFDAIFSSALCFFLNVLRVFCASSLRGDGATLIALLCGEVVLLRRDGLVVWVWTRERWVMGLEDGAGKLTESKALHMTNMFGSCRRIQAHYGAMWWCGRFTVAASGQSVVGAYDLVSGTGWGAAHD